MRVGGANFIQQFIIVEDKDLVNKNMVNAHNNKFVTFITRSRRDPPFCTTRRVPSKFWAVREGLVGGAREWPLMGAPGGGGVQRWGFARALI